MGGGNVFEIEGVGAGGVAWGEFFGDPDLSAAVGVDVVFVEEGYAGVCGDGERGEGAGKGGLNA